MTAGPGHSTEPANGGAPGPGKAARVRRMFSDIAPRYDLLNHVLSLNVDRLWRSAAAREVVGGAPPGRVLDACAGTLDLSLAVASRLPPGGRVVGVDFALPMLELGRAKIGSARVDTVAADSLRLPFADGTFDAAAVAFGVRNLADRAAGLDEFARVLKASGRLVVLEFSTPAFAPLAAAYRFYFHRILPRIGALLSRHDDAYTYLPESVVDYPPPAAFGGMMEASGFQRVRWRRLTGGIVTLHVGEKGSLRAVSPDPDTADREVAS
ncbi:MAG TPA: class I SAM-dependent methyltransferase [Longimicrobiales bacterium]|nr:class I SAM-dependent methyltransferase [Longimicrobiales bacterium]